MKRHANRAGFKLKALADGVPTDGGTAFLQGWDKAACPYVGGNAQREVWLGEWEAANDAAFRSHAEGGAL